MAADALTIEIRALVEQAKKNLDQIGQEVTKLGAATSAAGTEHVAAAAKTKQHHDRLREFATAAGHAKDKLGELGHKVTDSLSWGLPFSNLTFGLMSGGLALGIALIVEATAKTKEWHDEVARLSTILGGNAQAASEWVGIAHEVGIQAKDLDSAFLSLGRQIDQGSAVLHKMGVATQDAHGKLLPLDSVLLNTQHWFQEHAGSAIAATRAQQLFGAAGMQLLPLLEAQSTTWAQLVKELQSYGLILDHDTLVKARQLDAEMAHVGDVAHALALKVGGPLIHAFAVAGESISSAIVPHLDQIQSALESVVGFIVGVIEAFTGWQFTLSDTAQALGGLRDQTAAAGDAADTMGSQAQGAADAQRALREATRAQVEEIQRQIRALDDADRALEKQINDQLRALQVAGQEEAFADQQSQAQTRRAEKLRQTTRLQNDYEIALRQGNLDAAQSIFDQLEQAREELASQEMDITRSQHDEERRQQEDALRQQLETTKAQHDDERRALQDRQAAIEQAAQRAEDAMSSAASHMSDGIVGAGATMAGSIGDVAERLKSQFSSASQEAGRQFGETVKRMVSDTMDWLGDYLDANGSEREAMVGAVFQRVGESIGDGIMVGIWNGMARRWNDFIDTPMMQFLGPWNTAPVIAPPPLPSRGGGGGAGSSGAGLAGGSGLTFAEGGVIPGEYSMPVPITAHGREMVLTPTDQATLLGWLRGGVELPAMAAGAAAGRAGATVYNTFNIYDATDPQRVASVVRQELGNQLGLK